MKMADFMQQMFSEPAGPPSFGRGSFGFVIVCVMIFIGYQVFANKPCSLFEWGSFVAMVGGVTYTAGKVTAAWGANKIESEPAPKDKADGVAAGKG